MAQPVDSGPGNGGHGGRAGSTDGAPGDRADAADAAGAVDAASRPWQVYICNACGLLYDEREGDADSGLAPGTRFADIPDDWACPLCGVRKDDFVLYQAVDAAALKRAANADAANAAAGAGSNMRTGANGASGIGPRPGSGMTGSRSAGSTGSSASTGGTRGAGVVIVGAGRAGWQAAQALRRRDAELPITLVTGCCGDLYDKPLLSVAHAKAIAPHDLVRERGSDAAARLNVHLMPHTFATGLSPRAHRLRTTRGTLRYDQLILAQGARPRTLAALPASLCWNINHLDAYLGLRRKLDQRGDGDGGGGNDRARDVIIVGAGLVGCELANDLAGAGHRITLLDVGAAPLSAWLPAPAAARLLAAWKHLPITFIGNVAVRGLAADGTRRILATTDGRTFAADEVICATGLEVDRLLADSGALAWRHGIAVDAATLATSAQDVYALGDCITIDGVASRYIEPIGRQAQAIAGAITGIDPAPYAVRAVPLRVKTMSCALQLDGMPDADGVWRIDAEEDAGIDAGIDAAIDGGVDPAATASAAAGGAQRLRMSQWIGASLQARLQVG